MGRLVVFLTKGLSSNDNKLITLKQLCCKPCRTYPIGPGVHSQSSLLPFRESSLAEAVNHGECRTASLYCQFPRCHISSICFSVRQVFQGESGGISVGSVLSSLGCLAAMGTEDPAGGQNRELRHPCSGIN